MSEIDYTTVTQTFDITRWERSDDMADVRANWRLLAESESATVAAMPAEHQPNDVRFGGDAT